MISFINDEGEVGLVADCSAEFYFYPLKIFQYTSLLFSDPSLRESNVTLHLPVECNRAGDNCHFFCSVIFCSVPTHPHLPLLHQERRGDNWRSKRKTTALHSSLWRCRSTMPDVLLPRHQGVGEVCTCVYVGTYTRPM